MKKNQVLDSLTNMLTQKGVWLTDDEVKEVTSWIDKVVKTEVKSAIKNVEKTTEPSIVKGSKDKDGKITLTSIKNNDGTDK